MLIQISVCNRGPDEAMVHVLPTLWFRNNVGTMNDPVKLTQLDTAIPLQRMARPEEIASVVGFVAGEGASYLTATTIFADGGIMHNSVGL